MIWMSMQERDELEYACRGISTYFRWACQTSSAAILSLLLSLLFAPAAAPLSTAATERKTMMRDVHVFVLNMRFALLFWT